MEYQLFEINSMCVYFFFNWKGPLSFKNIFVLRELFLAGSTYIYFLSFFLNDVKEEEEVDEEKMCLIMQSRQQ